MFRQLISVQDTDNHIDSVDDLDNEYGNIPEVLTLAKLRQKLLEIRKQIF